MNGNLGGGGNVSAQEDSDCEILFDDRVPEGTRGFRKNAGTKFDVVPVLKRVTKLNQNPLNRTWEDQLQEIRVSCRNTTPRSAPSLGVRSVYPSLSPEVTVVRRSVAAPVASRSKASSYPAARTAVAEEGSSSDDDGVQIMTVDPTDLFQDSATSTPNRRLPSPVVAQRTVHTEKQPRPFPTQRWSEPPSKVFAAERPRTVGGGGREDEETASEGGDLEVDAPASPLTDDSIDASASSAPFKVVGGGAPNASPSPRLACTRTYQYVEPRFLKAWKPPWKRTTNSRVARRIARVTPVANGVRQFQISPNRARRKVNITEVIKGETRKPSSAPNASRVSGVGQLGPNGILPVEVKANHVAVVTLAPGSPWPKSIAATAADPSQLEANARIILMQSEKGPTEGAPQASGAVVQYVPVGAPIPNERGTVMKAQLFERTPSQIQKTAAEDASPEKEPSKPTNEELVTGSPVASLPALEILPMDDAILEVGNDVEVVSEEVVIEEAEEPVDPEKEAELLAARDEETKSAPEVLQMAGHDYTSGGKGAAESGEVIDVDKEEEKKKSAFEKLVREIVGGGSGASTPTGADGAPSREASPRPDSAKKDNRYNRYPRMDIKVDPKALLKEGGGGKRKASSGAADGALRRRRCGTSPGWAIGLEKRLYHGKMEDVFVCSKCTSFRTVNAAVMIRHLEWHKNGMMFVCEVCGYKASASRLLMKHTRESHPGRGGGGGRAPGGQKEPQTCRVCGYVPRTKGGEYAHRRLHQSGRESRCPLCEAVFVARGDLGRHLRTAHVGEELFRCESCPFATAAGRDFTAHLRAHAPPFRCAHCTFTTALKPLLAKHLSKVHQDSGGAGEDATDGLRLEAEEAREPASPRSADPIYSYEATAAAVATAMATASVIPKTKSYRRRQRSKKSPGEEAGCPYCDFRATSSRGELKKHLRKVHSM